MINQLLFIISSYIVGGIFSLLIFRSLKPIIRFGIAPLIGISFLSLSVGFLIMLKVPIDLMLIFSTLVFFWSIVFVIEGLGLMGNKSKAVLLTEIRLWLGKESISLFIVFSIIAFIFIKLGVSTTGSDSTQFEGIGRFFANGGTVKNDPPMLQFLLNGRLLVIGAMHCLNRLFGAYSLYALNPTLVIWFLGLITLFLYNEISSFPKIKKLLLICLSVFLTIGYKNFYFQIFSIHSNAFAMVYYSFAIICIYKFVKSSEPAWVVLGSFMMGTATLVRVDMLVFSLIFFVILSDQIFDNKSLLLKSWLVFYIVALPWRLFTISFTVWGDWYVSLEQILLLIITHFGLTAVTLLPQKRFSLINSNLSYLCMTAAFILILSLTIVYPHGLTLGWDIFIKYRLLGQKWLFLTISILLMIISLPYVKKFDEGIIILFYSVVLYILLLFILVAFYGYEDKDHSAGRIVDHIVPLCLFWNFLSFSQIFNRTKN